MKIIACLATSLDGKIAPDHTEGQLTPIGSAADLLHLKQVRNKAQAILIGGKTFRVFPNRLPAEDPSHCPLHCVLTQGRNLLTNIPPEAPLFSTTPRVPVVIYCAAPQSDDVLNQYPSHVRWVFTNHVSTDELAAFIADELQQQGIQTLSVEGGGNVVGLFLKAQLIQEFYLTLCPLFLAGDNDGRLVSSSFFTLNDAPRLEILEQKTVKNEIFLRLKVQYALESVVKNS